MSVSHHPDPPPRPIFIIGAPRSGTSIMNWVIGQHPNIQVMPETVWIATQALGALRAYRKGTERGHYSHLSNIDYPLEAYLRHVASSIHGIVCDVYEERCRQLLGDYQNKGVRRNPANPNYAFAVRRHAEEPKQRWIDGTPYNSRYGWALSLLFPEALFIHNLRNPADVALSLENFDKVGATPLKLDQGLKTWMSHTEDAWLLEQALGPERVFRLDYERIESEPEPLLRELSQFLDEDYAPACLEPLSKRTNSSEVESERPTIAARLGKRRLYQKALSLYQEVQAREISAAAQQRAEVALIRQLEETLATGDGF